MSLLVSLCCGLLVWSLRPKELGYPIDVIGYPTFHNFNYHPIFWAWRILVWQVPIVALVRTPSDAVRTAAARASARRAEREPGSSARADSR